VALIVDVAALAQLAAQPSAQPGAHPALS